jgi:hypothetical protein
MKKTSFNSLFFESPIFKILFDKKEVSKKCSIILLYLFLVSLFFSIEGIILVDIKIIGILTILSISISDLKYVNKLELSDNSVLTHLLSGTLTFSLIIAFDTQNKLEYLALKFTLVIINLFYFSIIYSQKKLLDANKKKKLAKDTMKSKLKNSVVTIEKVELRNLAVIGKIKKRSEEYEKLMYEPD